MTLSVGVSYSDFWRMTLGEINSVLSFSSEREKARQEREMLYAAVTAYYGGAYSRESVRLPRSLKSAFPALFGRSADGQILAENWQESERAMAAWAESFNKKQRQAKK